jgi:hypothetical protein
MPRIYKSTPPENRFWKFVNKDGPRVKHKLGKCWEWTGASNNGYGVFWRGDRRVPAHRYAFEAESGPIPEGKQIDHLCRNHGCVRPSHLEPVTQKENLLRGVGPCARNAAKKRCCRGHRFTEANTLRVKAGRKCLACTRMGVIKRLARKKAACLCPRVVGKKYIRHADGCVLSYKGHYARYKKVPA